MFHFNGCSTKCEVIVCNKPIFWNLFLNFILWCKHAPKVCRGNAAMARFLFWETIGTCWKFQIINLKMPGCRGLLYNKFQADQCKFSWVSLLTDWQTDSISALYIQCIRYHNIFIIQPNSEECYNNWVTVNIRIGVLTALLEYIDLKHLVCSWRKLGIQLLIFGWDYWR